MSNQNNLNCTFLDVEVAKHCYHGYTVTMGMRDVCGHTDSCVFSQNMLSLICISVHWVV